MSVGELIQWCRQEAAQRGWVEFPEELLRSLTPEEAQQIAEALRRDTLMRLPQAEIAFFEWLREHDPAVWHDLWDNTDVQPYVVGISFLPYLLREPRRGFPICDLVTVDNYYFAPAHITPNEGRAFLEAAQQALVEGKPLTLAQMFLLEVSRGAIDIWHFAYHYRVPLQAVKEMVADLVAGRVLLHLRSADELAEYVRLE